MYGFKTVSWSSMYFEGRQIGKGQQINCKSTNSNLSQQAENVERDGASVSLLYFNSNEIAYNKSPQFRKLACFHI